MIRKSRPASLPYFVLLLSACGLPLVSQQYPPVPLPAKGGFPASDGMVAAKRDPAVLRAHGWSLFQLAWENVSSGFKPRWYSWCTDAEMFDPPLPASCGAADVRAMDQDARMHDMLVRFGNSPNSNLPLLPRVISNVYISPALAKYIYELRASARPPISPSQRTYTEFAYALFDGMLNNNVTALPDGQSDEVAVKVSWVVVPCPSSPESPPPSVPVWNGLLPADDAATLDPSKFPKLYIDPQSLNRKGCTSDPHVKPPAGQNVAKRNELFWFQKLSHDQLLTPANLNPQQGDYMFVVAIHIITHEQRNWVWATYWLSDDSDRQHMMGKPADLQRGKGAHFAMDISLDEDKPIFNPFLEGLQPGFRRANCMQCHSAAAVFRNPANGDLICGVPSNSPGNVTGTQPPSVKTSFLWTLARRATNFCNGTN